MKVQIQIESETRKKLKELGKKGDSYNDIIDNLIEFWRDPEMEFETEEDQK